MFDGIDIEFLKILIRRYTYPPLAAGLFSAGVLSLLTYFQIARRANHLALAGMFLCMTVIIIVTSLLMGINPIFARRTMETFAVFSWLGILGCLIWYHVVMIRRLLGNNPATQAKKQKEPGS